MKSRHLAIAFLAAAVLGGCVSGSDIDGLRAQLSEVQQQVLQLQKQASSKAEVAELQEQMTAQTQAVLKSEADIQVGLQGLTALIDQLQANLGDTNYRLDQVSQQITATNQELKSVRSALGGALGSPVNPGEGSLTAAPTENPESLYQTAYNDYLRGNYDLAILNFRQYLRTFPETDLADNASYWIGESYFSQSKYPQSITEFESILNKYPTSDKTPSALLKKGYAYLELGQREKGVVQLRHVIRQFPETDEANLARQRLGGIGVDAG